MNRTVLNETENTSVFLTLVRLNTKRGLRHKVLRAFKHSLTGVNQLFGTYNIDLANEHTPYNTFFEFSRNFPKSFYSSEFFFKYIHTLADLVFFVKRIKPRKKLKKITPVRTSIEYIPRYKRFQLTTRILASYINNCNARTLSTQITTAVLYLAFFGKQSFLYKKKISIYQKLMEKKKFY